jgi:hypothetical protein
MQVNMACFYHSLMKYLKVLPHLGAALVLMCACEGKKSA